MENYPKGKNVLVMGLGRFGGGVDAVKYAQREGAKVTVTDLLSADKLSDSMKQLADLDGIEYHLGSHKKKDFENADIIIVNPAIPPDNELLQIAREIKKTVTSQVEIFFQLCPATIIGITGSNGKSTTTALTYHLLSNSITERKVYLTGNIGNQPTLCLLDKIKPQDLVVMEISSFQLEQLSNIKKAPLISLITNLAPNHLDRHKQFKSYCAIKENIFKFQSLEEKSPAVSIFNAEDKTANQWFEKYKNNNGRICLKFSADDVTGDIKKHYKLPGRANLSNLAASVTIAKHFGIDETQIKKALPTFKALPHRLELVADINGIQWYNDSKATTPESTIAALQSFENPIILIAGGYDKNIGFDSLGLEIAKRAKAAILIGRTAPKIASAIKKQLATENREKFNFSHRGHREHRETIIIKQARILEEAVNLSNGIADPGDVVLLSPACASYDMFENYEHRGREFSRLVLEIKAGA